MPIDNISTRACAITGTTGYLGSRLSKYLAQQSWSIYHLNRSADKADGYHVPFSLAQGPPEKFFSDRRVEALVHCSYDFRLNSRKEILEQNVRGSIRLMQAAREQGVRRIVFISTMSAFEGCSSMYGRAKLEIEKEAHRLGATVVRPGLIFGDLPGGMVGALTKAAGTLPVVPVIGSGRQVLYAAHEDDLARLVAYFLETERIIDGPVVAACEDGLEFRDILRELAARQGKRIRLLPIPWRLIWAGLRAAETIGLPIAFRSDSVVSLVNQDPAPSFERTRSTGVIFRPFRDGIASGDTAVPASYFRANPNTLRKKLESTA